MDTAIKYKVQKLRRPSEGNVYMVQRWISPNGGKFYIGAGDARYYQTLEEAEAAAEELNSKYREGKQ